MAVTNIPNITNWSVTPQNGQVGYFTLMNTWLSESTAVLASLQTAINAQNTANSEINDLAIQTENNANIAASVGNYQGVWSNLVTYSKSMGVSVGNLYYISKVDSNLNHAVTDTNYWLYNPINDKMALTGNQTIAGIKTFSSNIVGNITGNSGTATKLSTDRTNYKGTTDSVVAGELMWKEYGSSHTIIDASSATAPNGVAINNTNSQFPWIAMRPTLMGYNGTNTYGVRVDSARVADSTTYASAFTTAVGSAPSYACRAWVNFNGTGTVAIRASGNVSSITDNGTGDYTVNFTTAMQDTRYSTFVTGRASPGSIMCSLGHLSDGSVKTTTALNVKSTGVDNTNIGVDSSEMNVIVVS